MTRLTIYLKARPNWPLIGFRDAAGKVRIGCPSRPQDCSRPLTDHEIHSAAPQRAPGEGLA